jgi:DNA-binding winged helix-turn-helix (wHTH) protein/TolB-like protein
VGAIRLGAVQVDAARNVIANGDASWSVEPKIMDLLVLLAAHPGEVLSREFLIDHVWKVEYGADESLTRAVSLLRKTFREAGQAGEVIETIPKRGYRLVLTPEGAPAPEASTPPPPPTASAFPPHVLASAHPEPALANPTVSERGEGLSRRMIGGIAAAVGLVAVAAVVALFIIRPQASRPATGPDSQLIAFFGFTPAGEDEAVRRTAEAANDAMFDAIRSNWLGTVARTETRGVPEDRRFERATEFGARYAMGGDVRSDANGTTLTIRFEDVPSRLTLWERSITSPAPDVAYLPAQAARQAADVIWCIVKTRSGLTRDTTELLSLVADRCREGGSVNVRNASYVVSRMRAVTEADPDSAYNQAQFVNVLGLGISFAPAPAQAAWIADAEAALQRAIELDPDEANIQLARVALGIGKNVPAAEWDALILEAQARSEATDNFAFAQVNGFRNALLSSTGRFTEALPHAVARNSNNALLTPGGLGLGQAQLGRVTEARADLEPVLAAYGPQVWESFIPFAFFLNAPDAEAMLQSPPSTIPKPTVDCLRDIRRALVSNDKRARSLGVARVHACSEAGVVTWRVVLLALAALGDLDGAFAQAEKRSFSITAIRSFETAPLFFPATRAMRADPRFLPLVEKLGMMDYWRATRSQPDVCKTETAPFCAALKATTQR